MTKRVIEINADNIDKFVDKVNELVSDKEFEIKSASLRDQMCNYSYELLQGKTKGDTINRKGVHVVHDDMIETFDNLHVFLAHLDGAFREANNQTPLSELEADEIVALYSVSGFKMSGVEENKGIILVGQKQVKEGSISFEAPKIKLNGNYLYIEEITHRVNAAIEEVEAYMGGKLAPQFEQSVMTFAQEDDMDLSGANVDSKHFADNEKEE